MRKLISLSEGLVVKVNKNKIKVKEFLKHALNL